MLGEAQPVSFDVLSRLQRDVQSTPALSFRDLILRLYDRAPHHMRPDRVETVIEPLRHWDGNYSAESAGALAFETIEVYLLHAFHPAVERAAFSSVWHTRELMERTLEQASPDRAARIVVKVVERAVPVMQKYKVWGGVHRMRLRHPLGVLPVLGKRFRFAEWPASGCEDTVMKTGVPATPGVHGASYGSIARHVSDLSHPDQNYFAILGGQDGWIGSDTMIDQVPLWREGKYIQMPLMPETVWRTFLHHTMLMP